MPDYRKYYDLLGIDPGSSVGDTKDAYRKLVLKYHPDSLGPNATPQEKKAAEEYFKRIQEAYEAVSEEVNRDGTGDRQRRKQQEQEKQKVTQEEDHQRSQREEDARIKREKESRIEHEVKSSGGKWFFGLIIILAVLALGWYAVNSNRIEGGANKMVLSGEKSGDIIESEDGVWLGNKGASITMVVTVRTTGNYNIKIVTANNSVYFTGEAVDVVINNGSPIRVPLIYHFWDKEYTPGNTNIELQAGKNTITLSNESGEHESQDECNQNHNECTYIGKVVIN